MSTTETWLHLRLERVSATHWEVTFDHPPINAITATTVAELLELIGLIERDGEVNVVVFRSDNPDYYLAHYDLEGDPSRTVSLPAGTTGLPAWLDALTRLSRVPAVTIAAIRGRARGAGSEFALACDLRFADRANTLLGQFEVGAGVVPGGGPMARLSRLVGRGRALEIVLAGEDHDGPRAELYGYVNRAVDDLDAEVGRLATRLAGFDHEAIVQIKSFVDAATLPPDAEFPPALAAFRASVGRPQTQTRLARLDELGFNTDGDLERDLGARVAESGG